MSAVYMSVLFFFPQRSWELGEGGASTQLGYRSGGAAQKTFGNRWTKTF